MLFGQHALGHVAPDRRHEGAIVGFPARDRHLERDERAVLAPADDLQRTAGFPGSVRQLQERRREVVLVLEQDVDGAADQLVALAEQATGRRIEPLDRKIGVDGMIMSGAVSTIAR